MPFIFLFPDNESLCTCEHIIRQFNSGSHYVPHIISVEIALITYKELG